MDTMTKDMSSRKWAEKGNDSRRDKRETPAAAADKQ